MKGGAAKNQLLGRQVSLPVYENGWEPPGYAKFFAGQPGVIEAVHVDHGGRGNPYFVLVRNHAGQTLEVCLGDLVLAPAADPEDGRGGAR
jgi:hypothetical protein